MSFLKRAEAFIADERGAVLPFVAIAAPIFIMFLALVVDLDLGRLTANKLQISADAAALAGAAVLPVKTDVDAEAVLYAGKNYSTDNGNTVPVTNPNEIEIGYWDEDNNIFTAWTSGTSLFDRQWNPVTESFFTVVTEPTDALINSVWVRTRRDSTNNNTLPSVFGGIVGLDYYDISKVAIAVNAGAPGTGDCTGGGILSYDKNEGNSDNVFDSYCLYGEPHVKISNDNDINDGSVFVMPDRDDYLPDYPDVGNGNNYENDQDEHIVSDTWTLTLPGNVSLIRSAMENGYLPPSAEQTMGGDPQNPVQRTVVNVNTDIDTGWLSSNTLDPGKIYHVTGAVTLDGAALFEDVWIVSDKDIKVDGSADIKSSVLVAKDKIYFSSDGHVGDSTVCNGSGLYDFDMHISSEEEVAFSSTNKT
ncbi:MAG: pilus assembly protein TadG-related protein, partial [Boseongicola sp.]